MAGEDVADGNKVECVGDDNMDNSRGASAGCLSRCCRRLLAILAITMMMMMMMDEGRATLMLIIVSSSEKKNKRNDILIQSNLS